MAPLGNEESSVVEGVSRHKYSQIKAELWALFFLNSASAKLIGFSTEVNIIMIYSKWPKLGP